MIKRFARRQFGRLPYLTSDGSTYYLDLCVWVANRKLSKEPIWSNWCKALSSWTKQPLDDGEWSHYIPVFDPADLIPAPAPVQEEESSKEEEEEDEEGEWFVEAGDIDNGESDSEEDSDSD